MHYIIYDPFLIGLYTDIVIFDLKTKQKIFIFCNKD